MKKKFLVAGLLLVVASLMAIAFPASAHEGDEPAAEVSDQIVNDSWVTVDRVVSAGPGFMVIHKDNGSGSIGGVIGFRWVPQGESYNVRVKIDAAQATSTMFAMLHVDDHEVGTYEFGTVDGADGPVSDADGVIAPAFKAPILNINDQFVKDDVYTAASVTVDAPSWLVIHAGDAENFGAVLGETLVQPGTTTDVAVTIATDGRTPVLWPMLHVDDGEAGKYEFGTVNGADGPIVVNGAVATAPIWTVPHYRVSPQIATGSDGMTMADAPKITIASVLSDGPGFMVIHQEKDGKPGPVAGYAPVADGLNQNVEITLDPAMTTLNLWPMLHVDDNTVGTYEFGTVEGADAPVKVNDQVLTSQLMAAPGIVYEVKMISDDEVEVAAVLADAPGWLVIHIDNDGKPGPVAGEAPIVSGLSTRVVVEVDPSMMTSTVFPMLHYDTGVAGEYEFGTVDGVDLPVKVGGAVVTGPAEVQPAQ